MKKFSYKATVTLDVVGTIEVESEEEAIQLIQDGMVTDYEVQSMDDVEIHILKEEE